jgi:hypothetical protein
MCAALNTYSLHCLLHTALQLQLYNHTAYSVLDPSLAPPGCHAVHAYTAGSEPYALWEGLDTKSDEVSSTNFHVSLPETEPKLSLMVVADRACCGSAVLHAVG